MSTPFTTLKIAVVPPMPSAIVTAAIVVKPAFRRSTRMAYRSSLDQPGMWLASAG
jgi:hypothetical protein